MVPSVQIAFAYTTDSLVLAALKEFHVFAVDPTTHLRLNPGTVVLPTSIPTITAPMSVPMFYYGSQMVEVIPIDIQGREGTTTYAPVYIPLPPVTSVAQVTTI